MIVCNIGFLRTQSHTVHGTEAVLSHATWYIMSAYQLVIPSLCRQPHRCAGHHNCVRYLKQRKHHIEHRGCITGIRE